jgi:hypothetical protein
MSQPISIIAYALLTTVAALGNMKPQWEPPGMRGRDVLAKPTVAEDLISIITIGSFQVILEQTHLDEASNRLGATIGHAGEGGESEAWVCLQGQDQNDPWALWLRSGDIDNDIDGPVIGGFLLLRRSANERLDSRCRQIKDDRISLPIPIRLGMSKGTGGSRSWAANLTIRKTPLLLPSKCRYAESEAQRCTWTLVLNLPAAYPLRRQYGRWHPGLALDNLVKFSPELV